MVTDELIELNGLRFHYRDWQSSNSQAEDLVLLHGYTGHARSWDSFAQSLSESYRVLALDQRGHGETEWAEPGDYGTARMVADIKAFVTALGLKHFSLLGLSMGGSVAIHYAGEQPGGLNKLVVVDIGPEITAAGASRIQSGVAQSDVFNDIEEAYERARAANTIAPDEHLRHRVKNNMMKLADGRYTFRYDRALRDQSITRLRPSIEENWQAWKNIAVPTLLLRGSASDILSLEIANKMVDEQPHCVLSIVADSGHSIPLDQPEGFLAAVRQFL